MIEKRFTLTFDDKIVDNLTGIIHDVHSGYDVAMDFSGLLNTLNDENEQLKHRLTISEKPKYVTVTDKNLIEILTKGVVELKEENILLKKELDDASKLLDGLTISELLELVKFLNEKNQALQRHIKRNTLNKIRVEDVFNCAKYDKFFDNEEAIKSIDWIAKGLGVDVE